MELLKLFNYVGALKKIRRSGWLRYGILNPESVADHSFRTTFIAMIFADILEMDTLKILKMSLLHDIAEVITGDISPKDAITEKEKREREAAAMQLLIKNIPDGDKYIDLWLEYDQQKSVEAIFLRNIDKLEMAIQASEYQNEYPNTNLLDFLSDAEKNIGMPQIRALLNVIKSKREPSS